MTDPKITQLGRVEKAPRPPHVILLAEVMAKLAVVPKLDGLVICWAHPEDEATRFGSHSIGSDNTVFFLASRFATRVMSGGLQYGPLPSDTLESK